jgi:Dyp-type peroxidase family
MQVEFDDIQGVVRFGHGHMSEASFYMLRIADRLAAREWLARAPVTSARAQHPLPETALQMAFTAEGLRALGIPTAVVEGFSDPFVAGMAEAARSRRLGDVGANAPSSWQWGSGGKVPHLLVMMYATAGRWQEFANQMTDALWRRAFALVSCLGTSDMGDKEPFGFVDGLSQPALDWDRQIRTTGAELSYRNLSALGEFLLGYPNEYGRYTDRPLLDASADPDAILPQAEDAAGKRDLGRNGSYLVFRDLQQDVRGFWQFVHREASAAGLPWQELAAAMVGRTLGGDPLVSPSGRPILGIDPRDARRNGFTYETDATAARCPFGAHVRRANPRTADYPAGTTGLVGRLIRTLGFGARAIRDDVVASARFHRILRRGREYGPELSPEDALSAGSAEEDRGLRFICFNANISRQFEFIQNAWLASTKFDGLTEESDPLVGTRSPISGSRLTDGFSYARKGPVRRRLTGVPQFVTVRGGAYFFLPGLAALKYLASARL